MADTPEEALHKCTEAKGIFMQANMNLREFISNNEEVNKALGVVIPEKTYLPTSKFLGIGWDP